MNASRSYFFICTIFMILGCLACLSGPNLSDVPSIGYLGISKASMVQSAVGLTDSILVQIEFEDGDGDLGEDQVLDLFVTDNRTGDPYTNLSIPKLPEQGASNGINGQITFKLFSTCCVFPDNIPPCESPDQYPTNDLSLSIQLMDRAGNLSNVISTDNIQLICD